MPCTCAGTAPGYPQHESFCGQPEDDPAEIADQEALHAWQDANEPTIPPEED
jgi:hypothetical protein